ncbi:hypothetical protein B0T26DRAFT_686936 [Lasiosphaeria miniovina]|uniref:Uncharacterized protein n=1 Tax=Lasiosphaeria miniovina TaxID=1954250 RepID=A0AA40BGZ7_9PEZI|nr:uncharacterized protein B0T26DRAFT_686936 [Lasiosphaeria miniovina]KAK0734067.1 hypothetical protein B0T26DRAFT_686936 [Lasiosphaeria miniovina]
MKAEMQRLRVLALHGSNHRPGDDHPLSLGFDLERRASKILCLLAKLELSIRDIASIAWEVEYERRDLIEDIYGLDQLLKEAVSLMAPPELSSQAVTALGKYFDEALIKEKSKNWELEYQCRDLEEDLWKLQLQLRSSVPVEDITHPRWKPRTAMEKNLEDRIVELEDRLKHPKGRARSNSV